MNDVVPMSDVVIAAHKLSRVLPGEVQVTLVKEADVVIRRGEFVAITGPSGSGKSSLLYLLGLLDKPTGGVIRLMDAEVTSYNDDQLADLRLKELGFVFQFHFLLPEFTALENVMLPMQRLSKLSAPEIARRAAELLTSLGLGDSLHKLPKQLSGGQSQRVAIARALGNDPLLILADEPTGNLDTAASANVQAILRDLAHGQNHAVAVVTHDEHFASTADRIITIVDGRITQS